MLKTVADVVARLTDSQDSDAEDGANMLKYAETKRT